MHYLSRRFSFSSSHKLESSNMSEEENEKTYGACRNIHGHNYRLEVTVSGEVDPAVGFFCNVLVLKEIVEKEVVDLCDHRYLNDVPFLSNILPTMENLSATFWKKINPILEKKGMKLEKILLAETDDNWVVYKGI